jgi:putative transposase
MKANTDLLETDAFYHIFNKGINGEDVFKVENNYDLFLKKYDFHIEPFADTYAYCLLKNHFHLLIKTKTDNEILQNAEIKYPGKFVKSASQFISKQFAHLFNGYAQVINHATGRTGGLFETPFRRIEIKTDTYFSELIYYIHSNPQKHGFLNDFRDYRHSSYGSFLNEKPTKLKRAEVLKWFGNKDEFIKYHQGDQNLQNLDKYDIEVD